MHTYLLSSIIQSKNGTPDKNIMSPLDIGQQQSCSLLTVFVQHPSTHTYLHSFWGLTNHIEAGYKTAISLLGFYFFGTAGRGVAYVRASRVILVFLMLGRCQMDGGQFFYFRGLQSRVQKRG
jgi:hypothetical protein